MSTVLKARLGAHQSVLFLGREIGFDGAVTDSESVDGKLTATVDELLDTVARYA